MRIYRWTRKHAERDTATARWHETETETRYVTESWMESLTGKTEVQFFRNLSAYVRVTHNYDGSVKFTNIRPDKLARTDETFEPVHGFWTDAYTAAGYRERDVLMRSMDMRLIPLEMDTPEHIVIRLGDDDGTATFDLIERRWVG